LAVDRLGNESGADQSERIGNNGMVLTV